MKQQIEISSECESMLETALWSTVSYDEHNKDFMLDSRYSVSDISMEFQVKCQLILMDFLNKASHLFTQDELNENPIGHDFWLTLHGHGAGFWDGDYEKGDEISKICDEFPNLEDELRDVLCNIEASNG